MTQTTTTTTNATPKASVKEAVLNKLFAGPTYPEVAARLLRDALNKLYPTLDLDPYTTVIGEPAWDIVDDEIVQRPTRYKTLTDTLAGRVNESDPTLLIDGLHFLTRLPLAPPEVHFPVRIDQIGNLINELVPAMLTACQEQQLVYWNASLDTSKPLWQELSGMLGQIWNVTQVKGWTATDCDMARQLFRYPDLQDRKGKDHYDSHAYLIDIDEVEGDRRGRLYDNSIVVLIGKIDDKEVILTHSMLSGYGKFDSQHALGQSLASFLTPSMHARKIQWKLYEPFGNVFDHKACRLINTQIMLIGSPGILSDESAPDSPGAGKFPDEAWLQQQMPDWLQTASTSDLTLFAQHMKNLSVLGRSHAGKTYLDEIPSIKAYALGALKKQMLSEHADASTLDLEEIEIEIRSPVIWGSFAVPGQIDITRFSLVELALQNLVALPLGDKTVKHLNDTQLPEWMSVDYLESLITKVDIGRVYPQLIKNKLLDDPAESTRREKLYTSQLRIQLPMLALECKIRGLGNLDEQGYRYVAALMKPEQVDRKVDNQTIVLRPLAFVPELQLGTTEDVVINMFVIGPQDPSAGPCLLYRPMLEPQLCQYPSFSNLLYAIRETPALRQSVLAWLPDGVRENYGRYVFSNPLPSPWTIVTFAAAPLTSLANSGPIRLSEQTLGADFLPLLFKANANALVQLADRQSVSNSENRWETFKQAGWLIFNLALPYLGTTAGTAIWLWQILDDIDKLTQRNEASNSQTKQEAFIDLLLNLSLAIVTHAIDRARKARQPRQAEAPEGVPPQANLPGPKPELTIEKLAPVTGTELSFDDHETLHSGGALMGKSSEGAKLLETFSVEEPEAPGQPQSEGALKGLYEKDGNRYAKIAGKWFKVSVQQEQVSIIDGKQPARTGPLLVSDAHGEWHIDTHLRIRGGGSKGVRQKVIADAQRRGIELLAELNQFEEKKPEKQKLLTMQAQEVNKASGTARETRRDEYVSALKTQRENYEKALKVLIEWPVFQSVPDYPRTKLGYLKAQTNFTFAEIGTLSERFIPAMDKAKSMITSRVNVVEQQHVDAADNMIRASNDMIERLDYLETRFSQLKELGRDGFEFVRQCRRKMPAYKSDDLRLIKLDMFRHLCLSLESFDTMPEGWAEINQVIDNAIVAFQSLRDAIDERSVIRMDEQIDAFGSLTEQFMAIDEHLQYLANEYKGSIVPIQLARLRARIGIATKRTSRYLASTLNERSNRRSAGALYEQRPRPRKKFIRARYWGLISGEPRLSKTLEETDWVDVKNPFSGEIIVTFHHKASGEWVPHVKPDAAQVVVPALTTSVIKGNDLINGLAAFKAQIEASTKQPERTPAGIGMILNAHAARMEKVSAAIKTALDQAQGVVSNETRELPEAERRSAEFLRTQLEKESKALYDLGFDTVLSVIKQRPPTMSSVIWLKNRNQISITKQTHRQPNKGPRHDYLDRYEIKDLNTDKPLWFADFRYSTSWASAHAFLSAHLKTSEQVSQVSTPGITQTLSQRQLIDYYRGEIAVDQAREVFFPQ